MPKITPFIIFLLLTLPLPVMAERYCQDVVIYSKETCPHCQSAYRHFDEVKKQLSGLKIHKRDVVASDKALAEFKQTVIDWKIQSPAVPTIIVCGKIFIGFDENIANEIDTLIGKDKTLDSQPIPERVTGSNGQKNNIDLPVFGKIDLNESGLPLFTLAVGLVDGFNPCAMWVLLFLLSLLVNLKDRKRMAIVAGTFVLISGLVYFAFMAAWLNIFLVIGFSRWLQVGLGCVALLIAGINIKDYFYFQKGVSLHIPDSAKPRLYKRMRSVVTAERLPIALFGVAIIALAVNFLEFICTAGLPAIYTQILANQNLPYADHLLYLVLYNLAYVFDDSIMVAIAVITLSKQKLQESHGRKLKLISGSVIGMLGFLLIFQPNWLF